jgi:hypothetical protein
MGVPQKRGEDVTFKFTSNIFESLNDSDLA